MQPRKAAVGTETAPVETAERYADTTAALAGRKEKWATCLCPRQPRVPPSCCVCVRTVKHF